MNSIIINGREIFAKDVVGYFVEDRIIGRRWLFWDHKETILIICLKYNQRVECDFWEAPVSIVGFLSDVRQLWKRKSRRSIKRYSK